MNRSPCVQPATTVASGWPAAYLSGIATPSSRRNDTPSARPIHTKRERDDIACVRRTLGALLLFELRDLLERVPGEAGVHHEDADEHRPERRVTLPDRDLFDVGEPDRAEQEQHPVRALVRHGDEVAEPGEEE